MFIAAIDGTLALTLLILGLGFIIFVHELGHFLVAKAVGIRCTQFAIGFGHALFCYRKGLGFRLGSTEPEVTRRVHEHVNRQHKDPTKLTQTEFDRVIDELELGETEYRFNWMPLGGYVKMLGQEDLDPTKVSDDPRSYNCKPVWARMCVISAGVIMNLIFAAVFFMGTFLLGAMVPPAEVGQVLPGEPAAMAVAEQDASIVGMQPGDRILAINGNKPSDYTDVKVTIALSDAQLTDSKGNIVDPGETITFKVRRPAWSDQPARELTFKVSPILPETGVQLPWIGLAPPISTTLIDPDRLSDQAAQVATQQIHDTLTIQADWTLDQVNDESIARHWQYRQAVEVSQGQPLELVFTNPKDASQHTVTVHPNTELQRYRSEEKKSPLHHLLGLSPPIRISYIVPGSAAEGKLQAGDIVTQISDSSWPTLDQFGNAVSAAAGEPIDIQVLRNGESIAMQIQARRQDWWKPWQSKILGVGYGNADAECAIVTRVIPETPFAAMQSKLIPGAVIEKINGKPVSNYNDIRLALQAADDPSVQVDVLVPLGGGQKDRLELTLDEKDRAALARLAWIDPLGAHMFKQLKVEQRADGPAQAVVMGIDKTILFIENTYVTILQLVKGSVGLKNMSGPVGIFRAGQRFAMEGISYLLFFMGLLSVNLAVINFLPIPIVDGGHFVLLCIEKLRGKPVPLKIQQAITVAGLVMLASIFLYVTYFDIFGRG